MITACLRAFWFIARSAEGILPDHTRRQHRRG
jgi:hypothetical protein